MTKTKWHKNWLYIVTFIGALLISLSSSPSQAHWTDLSVAEITLEKAQTQIVLTFPTALVKSADDDRNGQLSKQEIANHKTELEKLLTSRISLQNQNKQEGKISIALSNNLSNNLPSNIQNHHNGHTTLELSYTWSQPLDTLTIDYNLFQPNVPTARCIATVIQEGKIQSIVFTPEKRKLSLTNSSSNNNSLNNNSSTNSSLTNSSPSSTSLWQQSTNFVILGIEHILTGYDHVLFLISLLMLGGGFRYLLKVVTAFTISHSVTLSLAVLNILTLPVSFVESVIALTIVYVALENFWRKNTRGRWLLTFVFGLVHGLGFAGVLKEINISQSNLFVSLASFNIGVEIGQILIVSIAFFAFRALRNKPWELTFRRIISAGVVVIGLFWFVQRAFGFSG